MIFYNEWQKENSVAIDAKLIIYYDVITHNLIGGPVNILNDSNINSQHFLGAKISILLLFEK